MILRGRPEVGSYAPTLDIALGRTFLIAFGVTPTGICRWDLGTPRGRSPPDMFLLDRLINDRFLGTFRQMRMKDARGTSFDFTLSAFALPRRPGEGGRGYVQEQSL